MKNFNVSIIIPIFNKNDTIEHFLACISKQQLTGVEVELIFVCRAPKTDLLGALKKWCNKQTFSTQIIANDFRGAAEQRHVGALKASNDSLIFSDPDVLFPQNFLASFAKKIIQNTSNVLMPSIYCSSVSDGILGFLANPPLLTTTAKISEILIWAATQPKLKDIRTKHICPDTGLVKGAEMSWAYCWSTLLALSRATYLKCGGFNQCFEGAGSEDLDLGYRLQLNGAKFIIDTHNPTFHIPHPRDRTNQELTDRCHERIMLKQHRTPTVETLSAFGPENAIEIYSSLSEIFSLYKKRYEAIATYSKSNNCWIKVNNFDCIIGMPTPIETEKILDCLWVYKNIFHPKAKTFNGFGFALPFDDLRFKNLLIGGVVEILPEPLRCRILSEALRIAESTYYLSLHESSRMSDEIIDSDTTNALLLNCNPYWERTNRIYTHFFDFQLSLIKHEKKWAIYKLSRNLYSGQR